MKSKLLFLFILLSIKSYQQNVGFEWAKAVGYIGHSHLLTSPSNPAVTVDGFGHVYSSGSFVDTMFFGSTDDKLNIVSNGKSDIYISKISSNGDLIWIKSIGGIEEEIITSITHDVLGNIYLTGYFNDTVDFDPSGNVFNLSTPYGYENAFILKLDSSGIFQWARQIYSKQGSIANNVVVDINGNVHIAGNFSDSTDLDVGIDELWVRFSGCYIIKLDSFGNNIWAKHSVNVNPLSDCSCKYIDVNDFGDIVFTGGFYGKIKFDNTEIQKPLYRNVFIGRLNSNGDIVWLDAMTGHESYSVAAKIDNNGNIFYSINYWDKVELQTDTGILIIDNPSSAINTLIVKINSNKKLIWANAITGPYFDYLYNIQLDAYGNVYGAGRFGVKDEDYLSFAIKYNPDGDVLWSKRLDIIPSQGKFVATDIYVNDLGDVFTVGNFSGSVDVNPGAGIFEISSDKHANFIHKMSPCSNTYSNLDSFSCVPILSPSGKYTWDSSGTYLDTIFNFVGCDSIITFIAALDIINTELTVIGNKIFVQQQGATFQWLLCDSLAYNTPISIIDSQTSGIYVVKDEGSYAVEIKTENCIDTSWCKYVRVTGIKEYENVNQCFIYPNPSQGIINLYFDLSNNSLVSINVYDLYGKEIFISERQYFERGQHNNIIDLSNTIDNNIVMIKITFDEDVIYKKILLIE